MHDEVVKRLTKQLDSGAFVLHRQKTIPLDAGNDDVVVQKIYVRLQEEEDKRLPPGAFVAILESCGLMHVLDLWMVRRVMETEAHNTCSIIPISHASLRTPSLARIIGEIVRERRSSRTVLCLEIAEADALEYEKDVARFASDLSKFDCILGLNAYTGSLSAEWLSQRGFTYVTFDVDFALTLDRSPQTFLKLRQLNAMCDRHNIATIADHVERTETIEKLRTIGIDFALGPAVSQPELLQACA
jgi:Amt family ammonium transporter